MSYSEGEIKRYLEILYNYGKPPVEEVSRKSKCWNCQRDDCFTIDSDLKFVKTVVVKWSCFGIF